ncbi:MAG TPA: RsmE family RNA methyltransferase [Gemmatimonadales bacterium]|jgi:16S rRNA (uracil1498-N3)-methyltransferase|nr:RsmE family RNA methyltransferase [Gemmatimonadales bacterium]
MRVLISTVGGSAPPAVGELVDLDDKEAHHLRVRRVRDGEQVEILDGGGLRGTGRLTRTGKRWQVEIQALVREARSATLTLAVATGDRDRFSWMVEKAAELGVTAIVPLQTARIAGVATGVKDRHLPGLRRHALEAVKQCGAAWAVKIEELVSLDDFISRPAEAGVHWLADQSGSAPPTVLGQDPVSIVIGPEGGLDPEERSAVLGAGYVPISLSRHTLRFETAAIAAAATVAASRIRGPHG